MGILNKVFNRGSRRGQLQTQETILAVFIFIILVIFGMVFFYRVQNASIADDFRRFQFERGVIDFVTLPDLPEFGCSKAGIRENCVDSIKLITFTGISNDNGIYGDYYFERFGYKNITIYQVYPEHSNSVCRQGRISDCGIWNVYSKIPEKWQRKSVRNIPVSLYFPCSENGCDDETYSIGSMIVEDYYAQE